MKQIFIKMMLILSATAAFAQTDHNNSTGESTWRVPAIPFTNEHIRYEGEELTAGLSQDQVYLKAAEWLKYNLKGENTGMRTTDRKKGKIAGQGKIMYTQKVLSAHAAQGIYFDYELDIKDGNYQYILDNLRGIIDGGELDYSKMYKEELDLADGSGQWSHKYRYEMLSDLHSFIALFLQGLKAGVLN